MKYLKLFENFDKYDFKKYTKESDDLLPIFRSLDYININKMDIDSIKEITKVDQKRGGIEGEYVYVVAYSPDEAINYEIFALGDYCYAIIAIDKYDLLSIEIFDDIESLLMELRKLKSENEIS